jgi:oligoendopeptidase F
MVLDEQIALEWARIPHFYYNYYVFQYATGYSAAIALSRRILREGKPGGGAVSELPLRRMQQDAH